MSGRDQVYDLLKLRLNLFSSLCENRQFIYQVYTAGKMISRTLKFGGKLLIFGNGGSAAEAQHFAAELVGKFEKERKALPAIALTTDTSVITSQSNDFGFEFVFSRQIEALGHPDDLVVGITTSDVQVGKKHSLNILRGFEMARAMNMRSLGLFSQKTINLLFEVDASVVVPEENTALIQEVQLSVIHILCKFVEDNL